MDCPGIWSESRTQTHQHPLRLALLLAVVLAACSAPAKAPPRISTGDAAGTSAATDTGIITEMMPTCAADNQFCNPPPALTPTATGNVPTVTTPTDCGAVPIDLRAAGVNIMIAIDGSAGMATHWKDIQTAIRSLRENNPSAAFGVHVFYADAIDLNSGQTNMNTSNNACLQIHNDVLELGAHTSQELVAAMGSGPKGGTIMDVYQVAPVIDGLNYYLTHASKLADPTRTNYLLVFTSGNDNCFGSAFAGKTDKLTAYQKLGIELNKLNIRMLPIGVDPPDAMSNGTQLGGPTGTGSVSGPLSFLGLGMTSLPTTDYEALNTLLSVGGSGIKETPRIDTQAKLKELISLVGSTVTNCRFEIPAALDSAAAVNPFELSFSINSRMVPRDRHQTNGWDFVNQSTNQVEFFGQSCQALQTGQSVVAHKSCEPNICGNAAVSVQTKPRMVLFVLDSSLSRTECTDGSIDCVTSQPGTPGRPLTYWETVQHALGAALVLPVNDDVSFGMQFFPSKMADTLSCDVATSPEVPPAPGTQILLMKSMLEKFPLGLSPVVAAMESVAAAPGKLVDPSVVGTVVLLSDGGDNCSGAMPQQIVDRLGAASKTLFDKGVKTYAIRYGSTDGEAAQQAAELTAIVTNGGTALKTGATPYIDAKNQDELGKALDSISNALASCSFPLDGVQANVDKNRTNLFLNGVQIGFDAMGTKLDGWNWMSADRNSIELYGDACTSFKTNRHTRVAVEFGCEPVVVKGPD